MSPLSVLAEAFVSLTKNKVRTALSMLGIIIGVASVIAMVAVGEGARMRIKDEMEKLGDDWLMVVYWGMQRGGVRGQGGLRPNEAELEAQAIEAECSAVRAATPSNRMNRQVVSAFGNYQATIRGAYPNYFDIRRWRAIQGRLFTRDDMEMRTRVCVVGQTSARELFGAVNPLGQTIRVNRITFEIIGVLDAKGTSSDGRDNDDVILFPWHVFQRQVAGNEVSRTLYAAAAHGVPLSIARQQIRDLLRQRHKLLDWEDDDFRIIDRSARAQANAVATTTFNWLLMSIASISLLVSGVGIMNIMLVSVTERTREIGLRMALGANAYHVLGQFLTEALVLCAVGGLIGFAVGVATAYAVSWHFQWDVLISYWMSAVAVAFAAAVGLFFGFYPAWRASRFDPIEALRYE